MMKFSPYMNVAPSATLAVNSLALQKKAKGERVYNLSAGEPMVATHPLVIAAANTAMQDGKTLYPPVAGIPELREAVVRWMNGTYKSTYQSKNAIITCGGKFGIFALCQAVIEPGDEVIIISPYWVSYPGMVELFGGVPKIINTSEADGWKVKPEDIEAVCNAKTKVIIINSGANPTGALYNREEMYGILKFAHKHNVLVVSDEVYSGLTYNAEYVSAASFPEFHENVVIVQSCSKHFAMTGWRVGFLLGPEKIISVVSMLQSQSTSGTSSVSQWAALAALKHANEIIPSVQGAMQKRRDSFVGTFKELFGVDIAVPKAGLYAFVPMSALGINNTHSVAFCTKALEEGNVAMVPGQAFGAEGYVRFSFGAPEEELREALEKLKEFISK